MNFQTFIDNIFEAKRTRIHKRIKPVSDLMYDQTFLEKVLQEKGIYIDDDNVPYFNDEIEFYDSEDFKSKFPESEMFSHKGFPELLESEGGVYVSSRPEKELNEKVFFDSSSTLEAEMESMIENERDADWINIINHYNPDQFSKAFAGGGGIEEKEEIYSKREVEDDEFGKRVRKPKIRRFLSPGSKVRISPIARENRRVRDVMRLKRGGGNVTSEKDTEMKDLFKKFPTDAEFDMMSNQEVKESEYHGGDVVVIELDEPIQTDEGNIAEPGSYKCKVIESDGSDINVKILSGNLAGEEISFIPDVLVKEKIEEQE